MSKCGSIFALLFCLIPALVTAQGSSSAAEIRTTFIYHIANYMTLPQKVKNSQQLTFCFFEDAPYNYYSRFKDANIPQLRGFAVRAIQISELNTVTESGCQLVFFDRKQENQAVFAMLKSLNNNIVTIGESRNFVDQGGIVGLVELQSRIKVIINRQEYTRSSVKFSSLLLKHVKFR